MNEEIKRVLINEKSIDSFLKIKDKMLANQIIRVGDVSYSTARNYIGLYMKHKLITGRRFRRFKRYRYFLTEKGKRLQHQLKELKYKLGGIDK